MQAVQEIIPPPAPQVVTFKMVRFATASHGAVVVWKDGRANIYKKNATPGVPMVIAVDGNRPSPEQLQTLWFVWCALEQQFRYRFIADLCPVLTGHAGEIFDRRPFPDSSPT